MYIAQDGRHHDKLVAGAVKKSSSLSELILMQVDDFYMADNGQIFQEKLRQLESAFNFGRCVSFAQPRSFNGRVIQQISPPLQSLQSVLQTIVKAYNH